MSCKCKRLHWYLAVYLSSAQSDCLLFAALLQWTSAPVQTQHCSTVWSSRTSPTQLPFPICRRSHATASTWQPWMLRLAIPRRKVSVFATYIGYIYRERERANDSVQASSLPVVSLRESDYSTALWNVKTLLFSFRTAVATVHWSDHYHDHLMRHSQSISRIPIFRVLSPEATFNRWTFSVQAI